MPDGRRNNGGHKTAGRKPKSEEQKKIELIRSVIPDIEVVQLAAEKARKGDMKAIQLLFEHVHGKPKERTDITSQGEQISIPISAWAK